MKNGKLHISIFWHGISIIMIVIFFIASFYALIRGFQLYDSLYLLVMFIMLFLIFGGGNIYISKEYISYIKNFKYYKIMKSDILYFVIGDEKNISVPLKINYAMLNLNIKTKDNKYHKLYLYSLFNESKKKIIKSINKYGYCIKVNNLKKEDKKGL